MAEDTTQTGGTPAEQNGTFSEWLQTQPQDIQDRFNSETAGLRSALQAERNAQKDLNKQLKELQAKAEAGSETAKQLSELQAKLETAQRKQSFTESAAGAGCTNAAAAWRIAGNDPDLWKRDGSPDWDGIKQAVPELFRKPATEIHAGSGKTGTQEAGAGNYMDQMIHAKARRR